MSEPARRKRQREHSTDQDERNGTPPEVDGQSLRRQGIRALRSSLADSVARAAAGERTIITANGRAVAQLGPLNELVPGLDRLISSGALIAPRRTGPWRAPAPVRTWASVRVDRALRELRG